MSLVLPGATSGAVTIDVPAVAGTNAITLPASTGTLRTENNPAAGTVIQVVSTTVTTSSSTTSTIAVSGGAYTSTGTSTGLSVSITPKFSNSKILIQGTIGGANGTPAIAQCQFLLMRGSTPIGNGTSSGVQPGLIARCYVNDTNLALAASFSYLDSPATTSATTYTLNFGSDNGAYAVYFNRTPNNANSVICPIFSSTITVMEIAQ